MDARTSAPNASVLLAFSAENTRSFRDRFELSLLATRLAEAGASRTVTWHTGGGTVDVLPSAAIYGGNGSGKTNVLRAMADMRQLVLRSFKDGDQTSALDYRPFRLASASAKAPTSFEVELVLDGIRYEYGFRYDAQQVLAEWAYHWPKGRRALVFDRSLNDVDLGSAYASAGRSVVQILRDNALFLSTAAATSHPGLIPLFEWFSRNFLYAEEASRSVRQMRTVDLLQDPDRRGDVIELLRVADLGIADARVLDIDPELAERVAQAVRIIAGQDPDLESAQSDVSHVLPAVQLLHQSGEEPVAMDATEESLGTLVWLGLAGPVLDVLLDGSVLLADELDASLHPALVRQLIRLFQNPATNPNRAQLIVNLHDVSILGDSTGTRLLGRDQCWFTEKLADGSTMLVSLADHSPRKEEAVGHRYLAGRYGGTPIVSDAEFDAAFERLLARSGP